MTRDYTGCYGGIWMGGRQSGRGAEFRIGDAVAVNRGRFAGQGVSRWTSSVARRRVKLAATGRPKERRKTHQSASSASLRFQALGRLNQRFDSSSPLVVGRILQLVQHANGLDGRSLRCVEVRRQGGKESDNVELLDILRKFHAINKLAETTIEIGRL